MLKIEFERRTSDDELSIADKVSAVCKGDAGVEVAMYMMKSKYD